MGSDAHITEQHNLQYSGEKDSYKNCDEWKREPKEFKIKKNLASSVVIFDQTCILRPY